MNVLITGAKGFIGSHLAEAMHKKGFKVSCFIRKKDDTSKKFRVYIGDMLDKGSIAKALKGIDVVIHLAGSHSFSDDSSLYKVLYNTNVIGLKNLLDEARKQKKLKKIIFVSSTAALGLVKGIADETTKCNPHSPYQRTKYEAEKICFDYLKNYDLPIVIIRPCMLYGSKNDNSQIQSMVRYIKRGIVPIIGNGKNRVPMLHIDDGVDGIIKAVIRGKPGKIYYIVNEEPVTMEALIETISHSIDKKILKIRIPVFFAYTIAGAIEAVSSILGKSWPISRRRVLSISADRAFDSTKTKRDLGFIQNISLEEGIRKALKNYDGD